MTTFPNAPAPHIQPGQRNRFGRLKRFDERSLAYPIRKNRLTLWRSLAARVRTHVEHRIWWQGDQGNTSQCTAFGSLTMWEAGKAHGRSPHHPLYKINRPIIAPPTLYRLAQQDDEWPGSETEEPRYQGSSGTGAAAAMLSLGLITGYDWEFSDIGVCQRAIFEAPLGFGIDWKTAMMLERPARRWEDAVIHFGGGLVGGHFIAATGYDKRRKGAEWRLTNSWGRTWGFEGSCFIGNDDLAAALADEGECVMFRDADDLAVLQALKARK